MLAQESIKGKPLLNWLKAIAHIIRCTQAAIYFLIKVLANCRKAERWASALSLEKHVWGSSYKEKAWLLNCLTEFDFPPCYPFWSLILQESSLGPWGNPTACRVLRSAPRCLSFPGPGHHWPPQDLSTFLGTRPRLLCLAMG